MYTCEEVEACSQGCLRSVHREATANLFLLKSRRNRTYTTELGKHMDRVRNRDLMYMQNTRPQWEFLRKHVSSQIADLIHESQQPFSLRNNSVT